MPGMGREVPLHLLAMKRERKEKGRIVGVQQETYYIIREKRGWTVFYADGRSNTTWGGKTNLRRQQKRRIPPAPVRREKSFG